MSEEEMISRQELQYAVKNVGSFDFGDFNHETIISVLDLIEKQDKMIDKIRNNLRKEDLAMSEMADYISVNTSIFCVELKKQCVECQKDEDYEGFRFCKNCIKEYFRREVENEK